LRIQPFYSHPASLIDNQHSESSDPSCTEVPLSKAFILHVFLNRFNSSLTDYKILLAAFTGAALTNTNNNEHQNGQMTLGDPFNLVWKKCYLMIHLAPEQVSITYPHLQLNSPAGPQFNI
jgi:hypothetical protein